MASMKNVTVTMDDAVADWARIEAAKRNMSLSRMLGELLAERMRHDDAYERAMHEWLQRDAIYKSDGSPYLTREQIYAERLDRFR
jgi:hypothetical protein